jgi:hypothetical protein
MYFPDIVTIAQCYYETLQHHATIVLVMDVFMLHSNIMSKTHYVSCTGRCNTMSHTAQIVQHATFMLFGSCKKALKGCSFGSDENSGSMLQGFQQ